MCMTINQEHLFVFKITEQKTKKKIQSQKLLKWFNTMRYMEVGGGAMKKQNYAIKHVAKKQNNHTKYY